MDRATASDAAPSAPQAAAEIRELHRPADLQAVCALLARVWRRADPPVTTTLLRALATTGNYVAGAYLDGDLVGGSAAFFAAPDRSCLHSHITGALPGLGLGLALKRHQRQWALARGVARIEWTFDPLIARNAFFNVAKLGAEPVEYVPDFYGPMEDGVNAGDRTDRLVVRWELAGVRASAAAAGRPATVDVTTLLDGGAAVALARGVVGDPEPMPADGRHVLVAVPLDIEQMRHRSPGQAARWRDAVRDVLVTRLADGARIVGFDRAGWYVLETAARGARR